jgi:AcrR family transcriptional regulator
MQSTSHAAGPQIRTPGRPRSSVSRLAIIEATLDLLQENSLRGVTVEAIAERAGVGKATIYKWWPSKASVALEAFLGRMQHNIPTADTGSAQEDFLLQLNALRRFYGSALGRVFCQLVAECQDDKVFAQTYQERFLEPRRAAVRVIWSRGVERGEIDPRFDCELVIDMIYSPLVYRLLAGHLPFTSKDAARLTEAVFGGLRPTAR